MKTKFLALTLTLVLVLYTGVGAISVLPLSEEELANRAAAIVLGQVVNVHSEFNEDEGSIYTYIEIQSTNTLKADFRGETLTLRQLGGTVGDKTHTLPGAPIYDPGDEVLVFAGPLGRTGYYGVLGIFYGKYDIKTDPSTGRKTVQGPSFSAVQYDPVTMDPLPKKERPDRIYLDDFLTEIESYLSDK